MRFAGISYTLDVGSPASAPLGKIPYIKLEDSPKVLSDTTFIIRRLVGDEVWPDLNAHLTPVQRTQDLALRAPLEEKVYFFRVDRYSP